MARKTAQKPGKASKPAAPLTAHRLFPPLVALWFSALFSLGSLAVRPVVLEAAVLALRIDRILPFAAPPLGLKARILVALAMAAFGAVLGVILARRLARGGQVPAPKGATIPAETDDLPVIRRRKLATEPEPPADFGFPSVPLPGGVPPILDIRECDLVEQEDVPDQIGGLRPEIFAPPPSPEPAAPEPQPDRQEFAAWPPASGGTLPSVPETGLEWPPLPETTPAPFAMPFAAPPAPPPASPPPPSVAVAVAPAPMPAEPQAPAAIAPTIYELDAEAPANAQDELASASYLALVNRLALSMEARRTGMAVAPAAEQAPAPIVAPPVQAPVMPPAFASGAKSAPRPFDAPNMGSSGQARIAPVQPIRPEFASLAPAPDSDREQTEAALRSALATLQKLSGAA